jgi:hypothetical protein
MFNLDTAALLFNIDFLFSVLSAELWRTRNPFRDPLSLSNTGCRLAVSKEACEFVSETKEPCGSLAVVELLQNLNGIGTVVVFGGNVTM